MLKRCIYCLLTVLVVNPEITETQCLLTVVFKGLTYNPSLFKELEARQLAEVLVLHVLEKQEDSCRHRCLMSRCDVSLGFNVRGLVFLSKNHFYQAHIPTGCLQHHHPVAT